MMAILFTVSLLLFLVAYFYPYIQDITGISINHQTIVAVASLLIIFVITPLYWKGIHKRNLKYLGREKNKKSNTIVKVPGQEKTKRAEYVLTQTDDGAKLEKKNP